MIEDINYPQAAFAFGVMFVAFGILAVAGLDLSMYGWKIFLTLSLASLATCWLCLFL